MYNRYQGNSGRVRRMEEGRSTPPPPEPRRQETPPPAQTPPRRQGERNSPFGPLSGLSGELGKLLGRASLSHLETEDIILLLVLYLLYKESGDEEFLLIMGAMVFL